MRTVAKYLTSAILLIVAGTILLDFTWESPLVQRAATDLTNWAVVIGACALGLGAYSLIVRHSRMIVRRRELWPYSVVLLVTMFIFVATGLITGSITSSEYRWIYTSIIQPISSTLYGMNAFFLAAASYRAFKARSTEATILLVAAIFLMLKNAPIGMVISPILPAIGQQIWDLAGATGMRGILIGIGVGTLALGLRVIIGQEKTPLGGAD